MASLVMEAIRRARPPRLYVAADGPRELSGEKERCDQARRIANAVDWPCEVQTLFRVRNLGCRIAVSSALDWFFEQEEEGIILEDDCVPSRSFFPYCDRLLERFRYDERVMCISGNNFQQGRSVTRYSYYFSRYPHCWGWASWRRAWRLYDSSMNLWVHYRQSRALDLLSDGDPTFAGYWTEIFDRVERGEIDTWDYQWMFSCWAQDGLTCLPVRNLVTNVGLGHPDATHTKNANGSGSNPPQEELEFPLLHPPLITRDVEADRFTHVHHFGVQPNLGPGKNSVIAAARKFVKRLPFAAILLAQSRQWRRTKATNAH